jgi:hypothetical protein
MISHFALTEVSPTITHANTQADTGSQLVSRVMKLLAVLPAIFLACLAIPAHADPVGCELNKVALARVVTKDARLKFVAGRSERTPACPSTENACRLKAYLVPGDEVLVDAADGPYVCAVFKSQGGTETRGWLPRAALQIAPAEPAPARQWDGKWERDREAQIVIKSRQDEVEVSGHAMWAAATGSASGGAQFVWANSTAKADRGVRPWPSVMIPIGQASRPRRMRCGISAPRNWSSMVATWWSRTMGRAAVTA